MARRKETDFQMETGRVDKEASTYDRKDSKMDINAPEGIL